MNVFQSLLLWNGGADPVRWPASASGSKFQSLLLWNGGADGNRFAEVRSIGLVSILVVVERGGGRVYEQNYAERRGQVSILVVVERGGGQATLPWKSVELWFQSLLLWNGGADHAIPAGDLRCGRFQSLLLWNGGADNDLHRIYRLQCCVSILVVVERGGGALCRHGND